MLMRVRIASALAPAVVFPLTLAAQSTPCTQAIDQRIAGLDSIVRQIESGGVTPQTANTMARWASAFQANVTDFSWGGLVRGMTIGGSSGVMGNLISAGETTVAAAGVPATAIGFLIGASMEEGARRIGNLNESWQAADQNAAIFAWLMDFEEYGRAAPISPEVAAFAARHPGFFQAVTGSAPPTGPALQDYLRQHSTTLFYFLGRFEEAVGPQRFPRWKFPQAGRYGPERNEVGYYRRLLVGKLREEIQRLRAGLVSLRNRGACTPRDLAATPERPDAETSPAMIDWYTTARQQLGQIRRFQFQCPPLDGTQMGGVWGTDLYTYDSCICPAAVHSGAITLRGGRVTIEMLPPPPPPFRGSSRNGVVSSDYGSPSEGAYRVIPD